MKVYKIKVNNKTYRVELEAIEEVTTETNVVAQKKVETPKVTSQVGEGNKVLSPIQGTVLEIKVNVGDKVKVGQTVCVVEAMKLENDVVSEFEGEVSEILVSKGTNVASKAALMIIK